MSDLAEKVERVKKLMSRLNDGQVLIIRKDVLQAALDEARHKALEEAAQRCDAESLRKIISEMRELHGRAYNHYADELEAALDAGSKHE